MKIKYTFFEAEWYLVTNFYCYPKEIKKYTDSPFNRMGKIPVTKLEVYGDEVSNDEICGFHNKDWFTT